ncbi:MAG: hypothetical protein NVSMB45_05460 [Ginsengibacter sp.]
MIPKWAIGCGVFAVVGITSTVISVQRILKPPPKVERNETVQRGDVEIKVVESGSIEPLSF